MAPASVPSVAAAGRGKQAESAGRGNGHGGGAEELAAIVIDLFRDNDRIHGEFPWGQWWAGYASPRRTLGFYGLFAAHSVAFLLSNQAVGRCTIVGRAW